MTETGDIHIAAIHGLVWIDRHEDGSLSVMDWQGPEAVAHPDELPQGRFELHWFGDRSVASGFVKGVEAIGRNTVTAVPGQEGCSAAVLLHWHDQDRRNVDTLDEAVELVLHAEPERRRADVIWRDCFQSIRGLTKTQSQTVKPVRIQEYDERQLSLRLCYSFWAGTIWGGIPGGDNQVLVSNRSGRRTITAGFNNFKEVRQATGDFLDTMRSIVSEAGGWLDDDGIHFSLTGDLGETFQGLSDVFHRLHCVDAAAGRYNMLQGYRDDKASQSVLRAMEKGVKLVNPRKYGKRPKLIAPDGREKSISSPLVDRMMSAGLIDYKDDTSDELAIIQPAPDIDVQPSHYFEPRGCR